MDRLEKEIQKYAIYTPIRLHEAPIQKIIAGYKTSRLSGGQMGRVYKIHKTNWVLKESRWDLSFELFRDKKIPLPAELTEKVLKLFSFTFLPKEEEILRQYRLYLNFIEYFGYFKDDKTYFHPNREAFFTAQRSIRDSLLYFKPKIAKKYGIKLNSKFDEIIQDEKIKYHNFLPKEYLLYGKSISKENKGKKTQFIFQEYVDGKLLHDVKEKDMDKDHVKQLILLLYLLLLMHYQIHIIPDTRPRYIFTEAYNWLTKTDNVIVDKGGLKFIDTRWFWDSKSNLVKRGIIIPNLIINLSKFYLNYLLRHVK